VDLTLDLDSLVARSDHFLEIQDDRRAIADLEEALALEPTRTDVRRRLIGVLANGPPAVRDPGHASDLVRQALLRADADSAFHGDLGMVLYRQGRYAEAGPALERSLAAAKGESDAVDLFFLAMTRHRLAETTAARADFDQAVRRLDAHPNLNARRLAELNSFRAEAQAVLAGPSGELPADVFAPAASR
jgi:Tfp pilus assembly protein PilF